MYIELKGIYFVYSLIDDGKIVYIGCSKNIYKRLKDHPWRNRKFSDIQMFSMPGQREAKNKEKELIFKHKPEYNSNAKDKNRVVILNADRIRNTSINELKHIHSILNR